MRGWLLDVNVLIALMDTHHLHHGAAHAWFSSRSPRVFGAPALVENGAVRVLSQSIYAAGASSPAEIVRQLQLLRQRNGPDYEFIASDISICDPDLFEPKYLAGPRQVTDAYLLGLAFVREWRLVSFDRSLPWQAVRGATAELVFSPLDVRL